jgi:alkanesulfonate monooxygenase SsuD/methylene tetrahydromethanopterin reductase-like flavin-dependent oxidoreductase (luciferase family)
MREVTMPALDRGLARSGRSRTDYEISYPAMMITGSNEAEMQAATQAVKAQLAFYGSTPAYKPVLDLHGWGDLFTELNKLSKRGEWVAMADLIPAEMIDAFAVTGPIDEIPAQVVQRYGDMVTRVSFYAPYRMDRSHIRELLAGFRTA